MFFRGKLFHRRLPRNRGYRLKWLFERQNTEQETADILTDGDEEDKGSDNSQKQDDDSESTT